VNVAGQGEIAQYDLPVLTSRRGIVQALGGLGVLYVILYAATGIDRFIDGTLITMMAILFLVATSSFIGLNNPLTRLAIGAPIVVPLLIAAFAADSTNSTLMFGALAVEAALFIYFFLQPGKAEVTVRGVRRWRLISTHLSFDEISGVKHFESRFGKLLRHAGFGSANVEVLLFSWKRIPLSIRPELVDEFIDRVQDNIDPAVQYDLFFLPPSDTTPVVQESAAASADEAKPARRRGKKAKQTQDLPAEAPRVPTAAR
jgi:hypothetical protein